MARYSQQEVPRFASDLAHVGQKHVCAGQRHHTRAGVADTVDDRQRLHYSEIDLISAITANLLAPSRVNVR